MKNWNYEFLQESFDEQQKAIDNATGCLTFLSQIRANQKKQLLAAHAEIAKLECRLEDTIAENTELKGELFKAELRLQILTKQSPFDRVKAWVGNLRR